MSRARKTVVEASARKESDRRHLKSTLLAAIARERGLEVQRRIKELYPKILLLRKIIRPLQAVSISPWEPKGPRDIHKIPPASHNLNKSSRYKIRKIKALSVQVSTQTSTSSTRITTIEQLALQSTIAALSQTRHLWPRSRVHQRANMAFSGLNRSKPISLGMECRPLLRLRCSARKQSRREPSSMIASRIAIMC